MWRGEKRWLQGHLGLHVSDLRSHWGHQVLLQELPRATTQGLEEVSAKVPGWASCPLALPVWTQSVTQFLEVPEAAESSLATQGPLSCHPRSPHGPLNMLTMSALPGLVPAPCSASL